MNEHRLFIRNMVCDRCILVVKQQLDALGIPFHHVQLGEAELALTLLPETKKMLAAALAAVGFELLDDRKSGLVEKIRSAIIHHVQQPDNGDESLKFSVWLEQRLGVDYHTLSALFSSTEGITIEKYLILQRIEKAKELLVYGELSLGQIAGRLGYRTVQHLSQQFKKITGLTPTDFRRLKENRRTSLDKV